MSKGKNLANVNQWFFVAGIAVITAICFLPSLFNNWVNWDDPTYLLQNPLIISDTIQWTDIFTKDQVLGIYHPLTLLSYAFDYQIWGLNPFGFHITNLIFHLGSTVVAFFVFRKLGASILVSSVVSLLFGIHPMHVESVAWISERKDVLYVFFLLLAWLSYLCFRAKANSKRWIWYSLMMVLFIISILSKPIAFVFPVILILSDYLQNNQFQRSSIWDKVPVIILAIIAILIAQSGQVDSNSIGLGTEHPVPTFFYGTYNLTFYLYKAILPIQLSAFHPLPLDDSMNYLLYGAILPFIGLIWVLYASFKKSTRIFFGLAFFIFTIAPLLQIIPFGKALSSERYTYLPYLGLFYLVGLGLEYLLQKHAAKKLLIWSASIVVTCLLLAQNYQQQKVWKTSEVLWSSVIEQYPNAYFPYVCRGRYYLEQENAKEAWEDFNKSIELTPNTEAFYERGLLNESFANYDMALKDYLAATKGAIEYPKAHLNAGNIYARKGELQKAKVHIKKALTLDSEYSLAYLNFATLLKIEGEFATALKYIDKAISLEPENLFYVEMRAAIHTDHGNNKKAIEDFIRVLNDNPDNGVAQFYLGLNYHRIEK